MYPGTFSSHLPPQCLKVCFPFRESETLVLIFWVINLLSDKHSNSNPPQGLFTIIDLITGNVVGFRNFNLPNLDVVFVNSKNFQFFFLSQFPLLIDWRLSFFFRMPLSEHRMQVGDLCSYDSTISLSDLHSNFYVNILFSSNFILDADSFSRGLDFSTFLSSPIYSLISMVIQQ